MATGTLTRNRVPDADEITTASTAVLARIARSVSGSHGWRQPDTSSLPHTAHARADIEANLPCLSTVWRRSRNYGPCRAVEQRQEGNRDKPCSRSVYVSVALRTLTRSEKALRHDQVQAVLSARHRDVEQPPFLLDFFCRACSEIRGNATVDHIDHEDELPLLSLRRMDRREDEVFLIQHR